jgi:hypothetical protein
MLFGTMRRAINSPVSWPLGQGGMAFDTVSAPQQNPAKR